jgi:hypothetical protein
MEIQCPTFYNDSCCISIFHSINSAISDKQFATAASTGNPNDQGISNTSTSSCTASAATFNYATAAPRKYHGIGIKKIKKDNFDVGSVVSPVLIYFR